MRTKSSCRFVRTVGHLKVTLLYCKIAAFIGATLCGIINLHGFAVRLFSGFVVKILPLALLILLSTSLHAQTANEIETLLNTNAVTYAQAVRFVLEAADIAAITDRGEAFQYAKKQNLLPQKAAPDVAVTLENISLVLMKSFNIKGGIFYTIAKNPHFAYRELVYKEIIQGRADPDMKVSGDQLLFMIGRLLSDLDNEVIAVKPKETVKKKEAETSHKEDVVAAINAALEEQKVQDTQASVTEEGIIINLSNIQFPADSATLPESEKKKLREVAAILKAISAKKIMVAGHSAMAGSEEGRRKLSYDRAASVAAYLGSLENCKGIAITSIGYGAERPLADNTTVTGMAANRRVEIIIVEEEE